MPRPERLIDPAAGAVESFAAELRELRESAGNRSYRELAKRVGYSVTTLSDAAGGRQFPALRVVLAYVEGCGGDAQWWEQRWQTAAADLAVQRGGSTGDAEPPYQGLASFEAVDANRFFGRERLVADLLDRLSAQRFLAVFGASGSGKSSVLRAGLVPAAESAPWADGDPSVVLTPSADPLVALSEAIDGTAPRLLVVDQFEEVFTLCRDERVRARFVELLLAAATDPDRSSRVVLGVRADFFASCARIPALASAMREATAVVGPLHEDELYAAVTGPAALRGHTVERALLARVQTDIEGQPGALPMLSHALLQTWRHRRSSTLTLKGYLATGGVSGAIARTAEKIYGSFEPGQQATARQVLLRLCALGEGTEDTRRRVRRDELDFYGAATVIDDLVAARLVVAHDDSVEIAHEALIGAWPRLHRWLTEDRDGLRLHRELTEATLRWQSLGCEQGALYRGARLALAKEWLLGDSQRAALTSAEGAFLDASVQAEATEHAVGVRRARQLRLLTISLAVLLVLVASAAGVAVDQRSEAIDGRQQAASRQDAYQAQSVASTDVARAMRLSLSAFDTAATVEGRGALLSTASRRAYTSRFLLTEPLRDLAFTDDGELITAGQDGQIIDWEIGSRRDRQRLTGGHDLDVRAVRAVAVSNTGLIASGGADGQVILWDRATRRIVSRLRAPSGSAVESLDFSPDGSVLAAASTEKRIQLWRVTDGTSLPDLPGHGGARAEIAFGSDATELVSVSADGIAVLWDVQRQVRRAQTPPLGFALYAVDISPDGRQVAIGGEDLDIVLWDLPTNTVRRLRGHTGYVRTLAFSPDGATLVSGGYDQQAIVWDVARGKPLTTLAGHTSEINSVAVSPDGRYVAAGSRDRSVLLFDAVMMPFAGHVDNVTAVAVSRDGSRAASASRDNTVVIWDTATHRKTAAFTRHAARIADIAFSPDGSLLATASDDKTAQIFDTTTGALRVRITGHSDQVTSVSFSPDGTLLATGSTDTTVRVWHTADGTPAAPARKHADWVARAAFSVDGHTLVIACRDKTLVVEDLAAGTQRTLIHPTLPEDIALSPDGSLVAVGSADGTVMLWNTRDLTSTVLPRIQTGTVSALAFSPDGRQLATGSTDASIVLWDVARREVWASLVGSRYDVQSIAWRYDGTQLYSGSGDRTMTCWIVRVADARATLVADLAHNYPASSK